MRIETGTDRRFQVLPQRAQSIEYNFSRSTRLQAEVQTLLDRGTAPEECVQIAQNISDRGSTERELAVRSLARIYAAADADTRAVVLDVLSHTALRSSADAALPIFLAVESDVDKAAGAAACDRVNEIRTNDHMQFRRFSDEEILLGRLEAGNAERHGEMITNFCRDHGVSAGNVLLQGLCSDNVGLVLSCANQLADRAGLPVSNGGVDALVAAKGLLEMSQVAELRDDVAKALERVAVQRPETMAVLEEMLKSSDVTTRNQAFQTLSKLTDRSQHARGNLEEHQSEQLARIASQSLLRLVDQPGDIGKEAAAALALTKDGQNALLSRLDESQQISTKNRTAWHNTIEALTGASSISPAVLEYLTARKGIAVALSFALNPKIDRLLQRVQNGNCALTADNDADRASLDKLLEDKRFRNAAAAAIANSGPEGCKQLLARVTEGKASLGLKVACVDAVLASDKFQLSQNSANQIESFVKSLPKAVRHDQTAAVAAALSRAYSKSTDPDRNLLTGSMVHFLGYGDQRIVDPVLRSIGRDGTFEMMETLGNIAEKKAWTRFLRRNAVNALSAMTRNGKPLSVPCVRVLKKLSSPWWSFEPRREIREAAQSAIAGISRIEVSRSDGSLEQRRIEQERKLLFSWIADAGVLGRAAGEALVLSAQSATSINEKEQLAATLCNLMTDGYLPSAGRRRHAAEALRSLKEAVPGILDDFIDERVEASMVSGWRRFVLGKDGRNLARWVLNEIPDPGRAVNYSPRLGTARNTA